MRKLLPFVPFLGVLAFATPSFGASFVADPTGPVAPACTPYMPAPPGPIPPDGNPHAVVCSSTSIHMGDAEQRLQGLTFYDYCTFRAVVACNVLQGNVLAWVGSWNTRPDKPIPGQPRSVHAEMYWYNYPYDHLVCHYEGDLQGTDVSMTLVGSTGLFDGCTGV